MKRFCWMLVALWAFASLLPAQEREVKLKLVQVSDLHGNFFPYDFIRRTDMEGGLARVHTFLQEQRKEYGDRLIFVDNGDLLQGQPSAYYYNFIDTLSTHLAVDILHFMGCDAANMGNHDIETGLPVFSRVARQSPFPMLGANIIHAATGEPDSRFQPYTVIERDGVRIAILGMIVPAIPAWLPETLWKGLRFDDMEATARKWIPIIREREHPHLIVGLFHSGQNARDLGGKFRENASLEVAQRVPGFDLVLMGHDHQRTCKRVVNVAGDSVLVMDPASNAVVVSDVDITLRMEGDRVVAKQLDGRLVPTASCQVSEEFMAHFQPQYQAVREFVDEKLGAISETISTRSAYFGPSAFVDLIHALQLSISGAEISLAAPLSYDARIAKGDITVGDMFSLYQYENMLYTMRLTGRELKGLLEMSYALWTNRMTGPDDHLLLLRGNAAASLQNASFNFDSAAGIRYTVDVTKPEGEKVTIHSMADGTPFDLDRSYRVAVNSYRGNGGGELLTKGAGIPQDELPSRVLTSTDKDLRYYFIQYIRQEKRISPVALNHWKFIPEEWVEPAAGRDYNLLFGGK